MLLFYFIIGLFVGSFINLLIDRLPRGEQIITGRSHCDHCKHVLNWVDLIPVFSWILLRGKCRYCHKPVPFRNTLVELITGTLFVINHTFYQNSFESILSLHQAVLEVISLIIITSLITIFFIDLNHQIIPDSLTILAIMCAIIINILYPYFVSIPSLSIPNLASTSLPFLNYLFSALGASGFFMFLIFITKGKGMGWGDVKFAGFMGIWLGFPGVIFGLYFAFLTGAIVSVILILNKRKKFGQTIAFGPFLVIGSILSNYKVFDVLWQYIYGNVY